MSAKFQDKLRGFKYSIILSFLFFVIILPSSKLTAQDTKAEKALDTIKAKPIQEKSSLYDLIQSDPRDRHYLELSKQGWLKGLGGKTFFRFGGFVQVNFIGDFQNTGYKYGEFIPALIPVPTDDTPNMAFDPRSTRITFETQTDTKKGTVGTFISMDFNGSVEPKSIQPELLQAYVSWIDSKSRQSILIGQSNSTMTDGNTWPESFDLEGPNAMLFIRQVMIRYSFMLTKKDNWIASIAIEEPFSAVQNGQGLSILPDLIFTVNWKEKWGSLRFASLARQIVAEDDSGEGEAKTFAWGLTLSGKLNIPYKQDNFNFQFLIGDGTGRYVQDLGATSEGQDAFYDPTSISLTALPVTGGFISYQHWWTSNLRTNIAAGFVNISNLEMQDDDALKATTYVLANTIYSPFKRFDVGLEYNYGQNKNKVLDTGHANRLMLGVKYSF